MKLWRSCIASSASGCSRGCSQLRPGARNLNWTMLWIRNWRSWGGRGGGRALSHPSSDYPRDYQRRGRSGKLRCAPSRAWNSIGGQPIPPILILVLFFHLFIESCASLPDAFLSFSSSSSSLVLLSSFFSHSVWFGTVRSRNFKS